MDKKASARLVLAESKKSDLTMPELCKNHGITVPEYYYYRKQFLPKSKKVETIIEQAPVKKKYKYKKSPKVVDIPLAAASGPTKIYVIVCDETSLKNVVGAL